MKGRWRGREENRRVWGGVWGGVWEGCGRGVDYLTCILIQEDVPVTSCNSRQRFVDIVMQVY